MLSLSKNINDMSETELKFLTAQRLVEVTDVIQAYVNTTLAMKVALDSALLEVASLKQEVVDMRKGKPSIPINAVDTFKYGTQKIIVRKDGGEDAIRCLYAIKQNGNCLAWQNKKSCDPPEDGDLIEWTKERWILINNKEPENRTKK